MGTENKENYVSFSPQRFYLVRTNDLTGISGTGRVVEGVLWQDGKVTVQWHPKHSMGMYESFEQFLDIHVTNHPSSNTLRWVDSSPGWHCFGCGAGGMQGNFCQMCGASSTGYHSALQGWTSNERYEVERELESLNRRRQRLIDKLLTLRSGEAYLEENPKTRKGALD